MNEAGGKHYGSGCTPWHLQRDMQTWGSVFIDARRTDVIEYMFRKKGDRQKQLDDAKKALHNCQVIIEELEKEDPQLELPIEENNCAIQHILANAKFVDYDHDPKCCMVCGVAWPVDQLPKLPIPKSSNGHVLITPETCKCKGSNDNCPVCVQGLAICINCNAAEIELEEPCKHEP